jgi:hypothetical protein
MRLKPRLCGVALATVLIFSSPALSGEFGNIVDPKNPKTEEMARAASAKALQSIQVIFSALEKSELRQLAARRETLQGAASLLHQAERQMSLVDLSNIKSNPVNYDKLLPLDRAILQRHFQETLKISEPKDIGGLYAAFQQSTTLFAKRMEEIANSDGGVLPSFDAELTSYLSLGFTLSKVSQL